MLTRGGQLVVADGWFLSVRHVESVSMKDGCACMIAVKRQRGLAWRTMIKGGCFDWQSELRLRLGFGCSAVRGIGANTCMCEMWIGTVRQIETNTSEKQVAHAHTHTHTHTHTRTPVLFSLVCM